MARPAGLVPVRVEPTARGDVPESCRGVANAQSALARPAGLEPATPGLEGQIPVSYAKGNARAVTRQQIVREMRLGYGPNDWPCLRRNHRSRGWKASMFGASLTWNKEGIDSLEFRSRPTATQPRGGTNPLVHRADFRPIWRGRLTGEVTGGTNTRFRDSARITLPTCRSSFARCWTMKRGCSSKSTAVRFGALLHSTTQPVSSRRGPVPFPSPTRYPAFSSESRP